MANSKKKLEKKPSGKEQQSKNLRVLSRKCNNSQMMKWKKAGNMKTTKKKPK